MENLQIVMVPLRILVSLLWCIYKKAVRRTELPLCEHAKIRWSMQKELNSRMNKKTVKSICVSFFFYFEDRQRLLLNCTTGDSDGHYTLLSYKFGMFFVIAICNIK